jgi:hypothetical protein
MASSSLWIAIGCIGSVPADDPMPPIITDAELHRHPALCVNMIV